MTTYEIDDIRKLAECGEPVPSLTILRLIDHIEQEKRLARVIEGEWIKQQIICNKMTKGLGQ